MSQLFNRARMTITSTGTGTLTLGTAVAGYQTFATAGVANGTVVSYVIEDTGGAFEYGTGTYTSSGTTLSRTVVGSSNGGAAISVTSSAQVYITALASDIVSNGNNVILGVASGGTGLSTLTAGYIPFGAGTSALGSSANLFWDSANNRLGIGVSPPGVSLHIQNNTQAAMYFDTGPNNGSFTFRRYNTSISSPSAVASGDDIGIISFLGYDGAAQKNSSWIRASVDGTVATNSVPGRIVFSTTAVGGTSPTERMRIDSSGAVGIGGIPTSNQTSLLVARNATGNVTQYLNYTSGQVQSDVTSTVRYYQAVASTAAATFTLSDLHHFNASQGTFGSGSTVTTQYGFHAQSNLTGATNNYGFYSNIASSSARWNFFANGTANNAFAGNSRFGGVTAPVSTVDVTGSVAATTTILSSGATSGIGYATGAGGTVTQATSRTTGVTLNNVSGAITLVSAAGSATYQTFTVTNSAVAATDVIYVNQKSGTDKYIILVTAVAAGSFNITYATTGGTTTEQPVFNFAVIKAVAA